MATDKSVKISKKIYESVKREAKESGRSIKFIIESAISLRK